MQQADTVVVEDRVLWKSAQSRELGDFVEFLVALHGVENASCLFVFSEDLLEDCL